MKTLFKNNLNLIYKLFVVIICSIILYYLIKYNSSPNTAISKTEIAFDTIVSITLYDESKTNELDMAFELCHKYEKLFSKTITTSDIYRINHSNGLPVEVDSETIYLVKEALKYCELSDGTIDITILPAIDVWDFKNQYETSYPTLPNETDLQSTLSHINYKYISINEEDNTITLLDPYAKIDLGFIAKGYIADQLRSYFVANDIENAMINLGGNVLAIGSKPNKEEYTVGIKKPFSENELSTTVSVEDSSVVTSGIYERYFKLNNTIYHHVLDPKTGYPFENDLLSVTILASSSTEADALSTLCLGKGYKQSLSLIQSIPNVEAIFITSDYKIHDTRNMSK